MPVAPRQGYREHSGTMKQPKKPEAGARPNDARRQADGDPLGAEEIGDAPNAAADPGESFEAEPDSADAQSVEADPVGRVAGSGVGADVQGELAAQRDRYLRLAAEYDNYRKRTARERGELTSRAQADLTKQLLDALDDLGRFAHVDPGSVDPATLAQGVEMVERKFLKSLGTAGLQPINPIDQTFDPALHEAVVTEPALSPEDDHVVSRVFQVGYLFNGQLLRPARVVVKQWNG
jgi:molecular chaperone GrpE